MENQRTPAQPRTRPAISVLLVDDQRFVGIAVGRLLASAPDLELHCCQRATDAIALANEIRPALILQDLLLPEIDGLTMVRLFRSNPSTAGTPIIMLSADESADLRARARAAGANDYIVKLPAQADFISCIRRHATAGPSAADAAREDNAGAAAEQDMHETLDRTVMAGFRAGGTPADSQFAAMLIDGFVAEAATLVQTLGRAQQISDGRSLKATAHTLKGSSMTIGARKLAALCLAVESESMRHADGAIDINFMTAIDQEFGRLRDALAVERQHGGTR